ncbi:MAG: hypothetical protein PHT40_03395 [Patescibacteria group bacterium]|nr:hypothetical protein [Patescibacteria group bacterium]
MFREFCEKIDAGDWQAILLALLICAIGYGLVYLIVKKTCKPLIKQE